MSTNGSMPADSGGRKDIRSLRLAEGLSFSELARRAGVHETELRKAERGLDLAGNGFVKRVAIALGVTERDLRQAHRQLQQVATPGEGYLTARPEETFVRAAREQPKTGLASVLDLFCGTGGFSFGFEQTRSFQVVCGIDLLPDRIETFAMNHPAATAICRDIKSINIDELCRGCPKPEVVIGGPPCQGFSSIRPFRTLTERDPRNNLFEHFALVVDALRPKCFVMENVVGLLTNQRGGALKGVLSVFENLGYSISWRVLNAAFYGLAQRRERFILVGTKEGITFEWPEPTHYLNGAKSMAGRFGQKCEASPLFCDDLRPANAVMDAIHDLPALASGESASHYRNDVEPTECELQMRGDCKVLTLHEATRHSAKMLEIIKHSGHSIASLPKGLVSSGFSSCYSRLEPDLPSVTLTVNFVHPASNKCIHPTQDRALTPREGARLQGFPDAFTFMGARAQIVKQIGNAVPPLFGRIIGKSLARLIS